MQVLGSEKVPQSLLGGRFAFASLHRGGSGEALIEALEVREQFLATSLAAPDPWSVCANLEWRPQALPTYSRKASLKRARPSGEQAVVPKVHSACLQLACLCDITRANAHAV